jgi:hypothetical protein
MTRRKDTVTQANQNEALLWKIEVLGMKKPTAGAGTFCPSPISGVLHSSMPEMSSGMEECKGRGTTCSGTKALFFSQNCNFLKEGLISYILCSHAR